LGRAVPKALVWVLGFSLFLNATAIWWGVQSGNSSDWADDSASPWEVIHCVSEDCVDAWPHKYPPFHAYVVAAAYAPVLGVAKVAGIDLDTSPADTLLGLIGRTVSLLMALGTLLLVYACAREMKMRERAAVLAVAVAAFTPQFVYYSKMMNLDVPYTFWFMVSLLLLLRIVKAHRLSDYIGFALAATCAIATKDQAYALYLLPGPLVALSAFRYFRSTLGSRRAAYRQLLIRFGAATITALAVYALIWDVPVDPEWLLLHVRTITGARSDAYRIFDPTLGGEVGLFLWSLRLLAFSLQWPLLLICVGGFAAVLLRYRSLVTAMPLVTIVSYYVFFMGLVGYAFDRFFLPVTVVLALYGGWCLDAVLHRFRQRWLRSATFVIFAYAVVYSASVNMLLLADGRYAVRAWLELNVPRSAVITPIGIPGYLPNTSGFQEQRVIARPTLEKLRAINPDYVVVSDAFLRAFPLTARGRALFEGLANGTAGYELAYTTEGKPLYNLLRPVPNATNLDKLNPRIWIYRTNAKSDSGR
jgi:4-amino-4-deoxy-L-arabinose transferase-like glycosyltransferase